MNKMRNLLNSSNKFHFIGIGGYGMSALAKILLELGFMVSGSDIKKSSITDKLKSLGAEIYVGHNEQNASAVDVVIYSACIPADNPELNMARKRNIPVLHRAELLAELMNKKTGIAISGAHGKTTTTTLISLFLKHAGFEPTVVIGAEVDNLEGGSVSGGGAYIVAEADESDGSFLFLRPTYSLITNIDLEHLDYYRNIEVIKKTYLQFIERTKGEGKLFYCGDDEYLKSITKNYRKRMMSFGFSSANDIYPLNIKFEGLRSEFDVVLRGENLGRVRLNAGGEHNILNCLGSIEVALELGINFDKIQEALDFFQPALRRCQIKANLNNIMVIDDYAHHPTEIKATLKAISNLRPKRIIAVFQPHRYSRTKHLKDLFIYSFELADYLVLTDIYSASEEPIEGVNSQRLSKEIKANGKKNVLFLPSKKITSHLLTLVREGDVVVVLGAGDVGKIADELSEELKVKFKV
jgi:UDP-N-acetylmuramate--alanine ligase